jgi:glycosyltransferase involved in cell wall biosynthesis
MRETFIHVVDSISDEAAGPSYSVPRLCGAISAQGDTVRLLTVGDSPSSFRGYWHEAYPADFCNFPGLNRLRFSRALNSALASLANTASIIHVHGLWRMSNVYPASAATRAGSHLVLSPRGMLGEPALRFSAYQKQLFWTLVQGNAARAAACLHATSRQEYEDIRAFGLRAPVAIIPNGVDVLPAASKEPLQEEHRTLLYVGRLHPKKGLDRLLDAWKLIRAHHPNWRLVIVGPVDSKYARMLKARIADDIISRIHFAGPLYGEDKMRAYRRADLFVLPTLNENFAMTVAEALAQGTPVISTKGAPWAELVTNGCGWWVDHGTEPLAVALDEAMKLSRTQLASMGEAGRAWMRRDFDWSSVAASMRSVYHWLGGRSERPSCVVMD